MRQMGEKGLTFLELLVTITIIAIIATTAMPLLSSYLEAHDQGTARSSLYQEAMSIMDRMTNGVRRCTFLTIPNAHNITRDILAFSGTINDDNDYYFNDPLFPRIDEDLWRDSNNDNVNGIEGLDDDGDGFTDEGWWWGYDDDEDGFDNEDDLDGLDNDGDGNIDEDMWADMNMDWASGVKGMDDDGDGTIDEGNANDDDEDGQQDEDPLNEVVYLYDSGTSTLTESFPSTGESTVLSTRVNLFQAKFTSPGLIDIKLQLQGDNNEIIEFKEFAYARNTFQKTGKRVR
jgi:prepilin-type N-terminal cleavage/methylation domain-containing protein